MKFNLVDHRDGRRFFQEPLGVARASVGDSKDLDFVRVVLVGLPGPLVEV